MADHAIHPVTGKQMKRGFRPLTIAYKGATATFEMPGWYPNDAGEGLHSKGDMKLSDLHLAELKARVDNLLGPADVRRIRKKLNLTQREAGRLVGGGPNAFQKYESGEVLVSRAVSNLLRLLARHPDEVEGLRRTRAKAA